MRTVFVTGAGGFAGARLVEHLRQRGYEVVAGVRNRARKLAYERESGRALVCDVTDPINVARAIASIRPDGVVHLAGPAQPGDVQADPLAAYQSIVTAWANVLDGVRRSVPRARILLVSACDVYGNASATHPLAHENLDCEPVTTFGSMKATAEDIAHTFYRDYHLNLTIARPFHYFGNGQPQRFFFGSVAQRLARWDTALHGDELSIPDLDCTRDLLHIDDVVIAYERLLTDGRPNEVYNVCSGRGRTCREVVEQLVTTAGLSLRVTETSGAAENPQIQRLIGDNEKIARELSWLPTHTIEDAARELIEGYRHGVPTLAS